MSDELSIEGEQYVSSKRAAEQSGYAQDYIGQLSRSGQIIAKRIGGLWYVSMQSLEAYKANAENYKPEPPQYYKKSETDTLLSFEGKDYVSASKAAEITGYNQDYVGQLARSGKVLSRQIGNRWYVNKEAIQAHKSEKDALLAAVQAESVGLPPREAIRSPLQAPESSPSALLLNYAADQGDLMPVFGPYRHDQDNVLPIVDQTQGKEIQESPDLDASAVQQEENVAIPIRKLALAPIRKHRLPQPRRGPRTSAAPGKTIFLGTFATAALTVVVVLSYNFKFANSNPVYTVTNSIPTSLHSAAFTASAAQAASALGDYLEKWIVPELVYQRK